MALIVPQQEREDDENGRNNADLMEFDEEHDIPHNPLRPRQVPAICTDPEHDILAHLLREADRRNAQLAEEKGQLLIERDRLNLQVRMS